MGKHKQDFRAETEIQGRVVLVVADGTQTE